MPHRQLVKGLLAAGLLLSGGSGLAFSQDEAASIYRTRFGKTPPSVQEDGAYLFVIQEGNLDNDTDESWNRVILRGQLAALSAYVGRSTGRTISPFSAAATDRLASLADFEIPDCRVVKVDELRYHGRYRHVSAFEAEPFRKAREAAQSNAPVVRSPEEWCRLIDLRLASLGTERERMAFWSSVGATIPGMSALGGVDFRLQDVDGFALDRLYASWKGDEEERECYRVLSVAPSFVRAHERLSALNELSGRPCHALSRRLKASALKPSPDELMRLAKKAAEAFGDDAWAEYGRLYAEILDKSDVFKHAAEPLWQYELNTFGTLGHSSASSADGRAAEAFRQAKGLYSKGQDLPRILSLLMESVAREPALAEKWRYLGATLRTLGKPHDAVLAYHQALVLDRDDGISSADLSLVYARLGFLKLARGNAWYCLVRFPETRQRGKLIADILK